MFTFIQELFFQLLSLVVSDKCYKVFFIRWNFLHVECLKESLSKCLGYGIVFGSTFVKIPQILKIWFNQNADGIDLLAQLLELYGVSVASMYSYKQRYPFSAWGDAFFMALQTFGITILTIIYQSDFYLAISFACIYAATLTLLTSTLTPISLLLLMQIVSVPIGFTGKMVQARSNYQRKCMGQQSMLTVMLMFLGSVARVLTSIQETGDIVIILPYALASFANGLIFVQFFQYPNVHHRNLLEKKKKFALKQPDFSEDSEEEEDEEAETDDTSDDYDSDVSEIVKHVDPIENDIRAEALGLDPADITYSFECVDLPEECYKKPEMQKKDN